MLRVLATRIRAAATSLTWVTPPGTPSMPAAPMVWIESTTSSVGPDLLDVGEHRAEVGLGGEVELVVHAAGAVGAQPHLGGRLLAGDVEGAALVARGLGGHLEQQRALADAGLAGEQDRGAGHQPAAEHPVELGHAAGAEGRTPRPTPGRSAPPARVTGPAAAPGRRRPRPRRPSPRPGTRRSGRPTWRSPSRTRCSGRRGAGAALRRHGRNARRRRRHRRAPRRGDAAGDPGVVMLVTLGTIKRPRRIARRWGARGCASRRGAACRAIPAMPRRPWPTSPSGPGSRGRRSPTPSTTPTCCAPTPSRGSRRRSRSSATRPTARPATCAPAPRT